MKLLTSLALLLCACSDLKPPVDFGLNLDERAAKTFSSPLLSTYQSCEELNASLKEATREKMLTDMAVRRKEVPTWWGGGGCVPFPGAPVMAPVNDISPLAGADLANSVPVEGEDFSGTNNQEKDVDEADIIKLDGKYFYILKGSKLEILSIPQIGDIAHASSLDIGAQGQELLVAGEKALIFSEEYKSFNTNAVVDEAENTPVIPTASLVTRVDIIDLSPDRLTPKVTGTRYLQGKLVASRLIDGRIHFASYLEQPISIDTYPEVPEGFYDLEEAAKTALWSHIIDQTIEKNQKLINNTNFLTSVPALISQNEENFFKSGLNEDDCRHTYGAKDTSALGFLTLATFDPNNDEQGFSIRRVRSNEPIVYASPDQFIFAANQHQPWWFFRTEGLKDQTTLHRFDITKGEPAYLDTVSVPGSLHNSFSLSEYQGYLRVATTTKPRFFAGEENGPKEEENHLFILGKKEDGAYGIISSLEHLAPGEKIWSARFSKDKGFLVTFRQVDPLFTFDLSDPLHPKLAGELKIPGVSTYLQDIGNNLLLSVGYGGDEDGLDFNTTVSLFDISNFANPSLRDRFSFSLLEGDTNGFSGASEANRTHLAVNYFAPVAMTAIPFSTSRYIPDYWGHWSGRFEYVSKLALIKTAPLKQLSLHGTVDHSQYYNLRHNVNFQNPAIRRSYFVGDYIYAISENAITATRLSDMSLTASHNL